MGWITTSERDLLNQQIDELRKRAEMAEARLETERAENRRHEAHLINRWLSHAGAYPIPTAKTEAKTQEPLPRRQVTETDIAKANAIKLEAIRVRGEGLANPSATEVANAILDETGWTEQQIEEAIKESERRVN